MPPRPHRPDALAGQVFRGSDAVRQGLLTHHQLRGRSWVRVMHDVYADARLPRDHGLVCRAALLKLPAEAVLAGPSAAYLHGVAHAAAFSDDVHVLVPRAIRIDSPRGIRVHSAGPATPGTDPTGAPPGAHVPTGAPPDAHVPGGAHRARTSRVAHHRVGSAGPIPPPRPGSARSGSIRSARSASSTRSSRRASPAAPRSRTWPPRTSPGRAAGGRAGSSAWRTPPPSRRPSRTCGCGWCSPGFPPGGSVSGTPADRPVPARPRVAGVPSGGRVRRPVAARPRPTPPPAPRPRPAPRAAP